MIRQKPHSERLEMLRRVDRLVNSPAFVRKTTDRVAELTRGKGAVIPRKRPDGKPGER